MLPSDVKCLSTTATSVSLHLFLDSELFWFKGHFPNHPLLPGVAQLHWANHYAQRYLNLTGQFSAMQAVKFQNPATEGETLELKLQWVAEKELLIFTYHSVKSATELQPVSSGKIRFTQ